MWLVGGTLRDLLLGRSTPEVDAVVERGAGAIAAKLEEAGFGRSVLLSAKAPRVFRVAGGRDVDLADLEGGSIEIDLARRDFTVNALAFDPDEGLWLDPFGGRRDLAERRLRVVRPENLLDDPLRVLRAARLFATHGLRPDRATTRACRPAAAGLVDAAPERIRSELVKLLEASRVAPALRWAGRAGALGPVLAVPRDSLGKIGRALARLDAPEIARSSSLERVRVRLALLASEAGFGASAASRWLASRRFSRAESGAVGRVIDLAERAREISGGREAWAWARDAGDEWRTALALLRLRWPAQSRKAAALSRRARVRRPRLRVGGGDILEWTGLSPGPRVGELLRELEIEALRGTVRTKREAQQWARRRAAAAGDGGGQVII